MVSDCCTFEKNEKWSRGTGTRKHAWFNPLVLLSKNLAGLRWLGDLSTLPKTVPLLPTA
jgi:hypothetical protein